MIKKIGLAIVFGAAGTAIFVLGSPYYSVFPTNRNPAFALLLTLFFLIGALLTSRIAGLKAGWRAVYALFMASAALLFLEWGPMIIPLPQEPLLKITLDKLLQFAHVVPVLLLLTILSRARLDSIYLSWGNWKTGLVVGLLTFVLMGAAGFLQTPVGLRSVPNLLNALPWILLFVFANSIMEEIWFRGIFLLHYRELMGSGLAILVSALVFGASHLNATYDFPGGMLGFGMIVAGLGAAWAYLILRTRSILASVLFHAGADLLLIVPILDSLM